MPQPAGITTHGKRLRKDLVPHDKTVGVSDYVKNMVHELGVTVHSCGVLEPRRLRCHHARMIMVDGRSRLPSEIYPDA